MDDTRKTQAQFGQTAAHYRTSRVHATGKDLAWLADKVQELAPVRVLDMGCGAGHTSAAVAPYAAKVTAVDITAAMLDQVEQLAAERDLTNIETICANVESLPFKDQSFDVVISRYSAHHWFNPLTALTECHRVLKHSGRFFLIDILGLDTTHDDTFLQSIELLRDPSHVRDYTVDEWLTMLTAANFAADITLQWDLPLNFEDWVARMAVPDSHKQVIQELMDGAIGSAREALQIRENYDFTLQAGLFVAEARSS